MTHATIEATEITDAQQGNERALESILSKMLPMRRDLVGKVYPYHLHDDGMSVALEANWLAVMSYKTDSSSKFTAHAYSQMRYALITEVSTTSNGTSGLAHSVAHRYRALLASTDGDVADAAALADQPDSGLTAATFMAAHEAMAVSPSLDLVYDTLDYTTPSVEDTVIDMLELDRMLDELTSEQATIIRMAFGIGVASEMTDSEIGDALGLPRLTVQRRRVAALATMKLAA
jgi:DNA-directed RNA polymerase specialized sigma24 family protein